VTLCTTFDKAAKFTESYSSANPSGVSTDKAFTQAKHGKHACDMDWRLNFMTVHFRSSFEDFTHEANIKFMEGKGWFTTFKMTGSFTT